MLMRAWRGVPEPEPLDSVLGSRAGRAPFSNSPVLPSSIFRLPRPSQLHITWQEERPFPKLTLSPGLFLAHQCKGWGILHTPVRAGGLPWVPAASLGRGVQQPNPWSRGPLCRLQASKQDQGGPIHGKPPPWRGKTGIGVIPVPCFGREHHLLPPVGDEGLPGERRTQALSKVGLIFIHF